MKPENDGERIIALETNMTNIAKDISDIKADIKNINMQLNQQISKQPSLEGEIIALKKELLDVKIEFAGQLADIKRSSNLWKWLAPTLTGLAVMILSVTITFLWMNYIQKF
jgi:uncharacterized protein (UPF0335 family)